MEEPGQDKKDRAIEQVLGNLLRAGVLLAATVVLAGAVRYLSRHGGERPDYRVFRPADRQDLRTPAGIVGDARHGQGRGIIQLGLLLLIATPVARVIFSVFAFASERDTTYVLLTLIVLAVLLYSLFFGHLG